MKYIGTICLLFLILPMLLAQSEEEESVSEVYERELLERTHRNQLENYGVVVIQKGNVNNSAVDIHSEGENSSVIVTQIGDQNAASVFGETSQSRVGILQEGTFNDLSLELRNDFKSELEFFQFGNNNTIDQKLNTSLNASMHIKQYGDDHLLEFETDLIEIQGLRITQMGQGAELIIIQ